MLFQTSPITAARAANSLLPLHASDTCRPGPASFATDTHPSISHQRARSSDSPAVAAAARVRVTARYHCHGWHALPSAASISIKPSASTMRQWPVVALHNRRAASVGFHDEQEYVHGPHSPVAVPWTPNQTAVEPFCALMRPQSRRQMGGTVPIRHLVL